MRHGPVAGLRMPGPIAPPPTLLSVGSAATDALQLLSARRGQSVRTKGIRMNLVSGPHIDPQRDEAQGAERAPVFHRREDEARWTKHRGPRPRIACRVVNVERRKELRVVRLRSGRRSRFRHERRRERQRKRQREQCAGCSLATRSAEGRGSSGAQQRAGRHYLRPRWVLLSGQRMLHHAERDK